MGGELPLKPKGMHRQTYRKETARIESYENACNFPSVAVHRPALITSRSARTQTRPVLFSLPDGWSSDEYR